MLMVVVTLITSDLALQLVSSMSTEDLKRDPSEVPEKCMSNSALVMNQAGENSTLSSRCTSL